MFLSLSQFTLHFNFWRGSTIIILFSYELLPPTLTLSIKITPNFIFPSVEKVKTYIYLIRTKILSEVYNYDPNFQNFHP